jgi:hypothetical protein
VETPHDRGHFITRQDMHPSSPMRVLVHTLVPRRRTGQ